MRATDGQKRSWSSKELPACWQTSTFWTALQRTLCNFVTGTWCIPLRSPRTTINGGKASSRWLAALSSNRRRKECRTHRWSWSATPAFAGVLLSSSRNKGWGTLFAIGQSVFQNIWCRRACTGTECRPLSVGWNSRTCNFFQHQGLPEK